MKIITPLTEDVIKKLSAGDKVTLSGVIYTGRDAAHKKIYDEIILAKKENRAHKLPFDLKGSVIYYVGPTPPKPGQVIGSAGPTTSYRMDAYSSLLMEYGLKGMIGKGKRSTDVIEAMKKFHGVYFAAVGGAAVLLAQHIKKAEVIAFEDLGTEAVRRLEVEDFPLIVINDIQGKDLYEIGVKQYARV
jgi:fumarate hydratase subunit beta